MRICILANVLSVHTQRWARAYAACGHDVHVISIRSADLKNIRVWPVHLGPVNTRATSWTFLSYLYLLAMLRHRLKCIQPDVLHCHFSVTHGLLAAFSGFHPVVLSVWGSDIVWHRTAKAPFLFRWINRLACSHADLITATSRFLLGEVERLIGHSERLRHIPFGVDCNVFAAGLPERCQNERGLLRIGFVKRLAPIYGPDVLIRALSQLLKSVPNVRLVMAGGGGQREQLERLAMELQVRDKVEFCGHVPNDQVPELLATFDIFVNPSVCQESFGVSILEASASGLPVVATRVGGVPEVCLDERTGLLVPPGNPEALAQALIQLALDPVLRRSMGESGREFVMKHYRWDDNVTAMLCLFAQLTNTSKSDSICLPT